MPLSAFISSRWLSPLLCVSLALPLAVSAKAEDQSIVSPGGPIGDFIDEIISPLAGQMSDDGITHLKYKLGYLFAKTERQGLQKTSGDLDVLFYRMFDLAALGSGTLIEEMGKDKDMKDTRVREAIYKELLAWLDTRRFPLKKELIEIYTTATAKTGTGYTVCVEGKDRRYEFSEGRFHRLADSAIPCTPIEPKQPKSLKWDENDKPVGK